MARFDDYGCNLGQDGGTIDCILSEGVPMIDTSGGNESEKLAQGNFDDCSWASIDSNSGRRKDDEACEGAADSGHPFRHRAHLTDHRTVNPPFGA